MSTSKFWSVFDGFDFLLNIKALDKEDAQGLALAQLGLSAEKIKNLNIFLAGDSVTTLVSRNTFSLFQEHGGVTFDWPGREQTTRAISRGECETMLESMRDWLAQPDAILLAENVGSDLGYVQAQIAEIQGLLSNPRWSCHQWVKFEPFHNDSRVADEDAAGADAYCNALYTSTPED